MRRIYEPMLAQSAEAPFSSRDWIFEIKWDGIRAISYINNEFSIRSRNGNELKNNFPELKELKELTSNTVLDGEIIVMNEGKVDFQTLIERAKASSSRDIEHLRQRFPATYVVFDIIEKDGEPLINYRLIERKKMLKEFIREGKYVILSMFMEGEGEDYYKVAIKSGVEGVMAKRKDSVYTPGRRSGDWLKIKRLKACDCVVFGYTRGEGIRQGTFGALILGLYEGEKPVYVGKVGTGFSENDIDSLMRNFKRLEVKERTLQEVKITGEITWLRAELVCEVVYQAVTKDGKLRMPRFRGIRLDKTAANCTIDQIRPRRLKEYLFKRNFSSTPEPRQTEVKKEMPKEGMVYVVQEHHARRLHYDLRLEKEGVLKSWAIPKGLPEVPGDKRLAIQVEDHPLEYRAFEGEIPKGEYGAGTVKIWDKGSYEPAIWNDDMIEIFIKGNRIQGRYVLTRFKKAGKNQWLILKVRDKS